MFERIIRLAIEHRWLVLLAVLGMAGLGIYNYQRRSTRFLISRMSRCRSTRLHRVIRRWKSSSG